MVSPAFFSLRREHGGSPLRFGRTVPQAYEYRRREKIVKINMMVFIVKRLYHIGNYIVAKTIFASFVLLFAEVNLVIQDEAMF
jgi:hypothetical protein